MANPLFRLALRDRVDLLLRVSFGVFVLAGCWFVLQPFLTAIILAAILAVVTWPVFVRVMATLRGSATAASSVMVLAMVITVLIPIAVLCVMLANEIPGIVELVRAWIEGGMKPPEWLGRIPYFDEYVLPYLSSLETRNIAAMLGKAVDPLSRSFLSVSLSIGNGLFQVALVAFVLFFFYRDGRRLAHHAGSVLNRVSGNLAREFMDILVNTTRSVFFGILGSAVGQGMAAGLGFYIAGVPGIVMLSFCTMVLSIVPVGPPLVWIPAALWLYAHGSLGWAVFLCLWGVLVVSSVDNFIKPILISRGSSLPLALIFLGVFGGVIAFGFLGIVLGPIFLAAGIAMINAWLERPRGAARSEESSGS